MNLGGCIQKKIFILKTQFFHRLYQMFKNLKIHQCPLNGPGIVVLLMMAINEKLNSVNINIQF